MLCDVQKRIEDESYWYKLKYVFFKMMVKYIFIYLNCIRFRNFVFLFLERVDFFFYKSECLVYDIDVLR